MYVPGMRTKRRDIDGTSLGLGLLLLGTSLVVGGQPVSYVELKAETWVSALASPTGTAQTVQLSPIAMRRRLVSIRDFEAFVRTHPYWQKGRGSLLVQGTDYLKNWQQPLQSGMESTDQQPVTWVSWYAARAYCASEGGRLPTWFEWERVAAASGTDADARNKPGYAQHHLDQWLAFAVTPPQGVTVNNSPNYYGLYDLHGAKWEWLEDYAAMFPSADPRDPGEGSSLALCGGAALAFRDRRDYTLMLGVAALTALRPDDSSASVGFRCVRDWRE